MAITLLLMNIFKLFSLEETVYNTSYLTANQLTATCSALLTLSGYKYVSNNERDQSSVKINKADSRVVTKGNILNGKYGDKFNC